MRVTTYLPAPLPDWPARHVWFFPSGIDEHLEPGLCTWAAATLGDPAIPVGDRYYLFTASLDNTSDLVTAAGRPFVWRGYRGQLLGVTPGPEDDT